MNFYKKLIPSQSLRLKLLSLLSPVPDVIMIQLQYLIKTGRSAKISCPKRYTEKIQWYKLNYRNPKIKQCSDKFDVREYVRNKGFESILNEIYELWISIDEVDLSSLPSTFILKATHGSGTNFLVEDKENLDYGVMKSIIQDWFLHDSACIGREWGYKDIAPKVIAEKILPRNTRGDLPDYKFFCFDGKVYCLYVMRDYTDDHEKGELAFFDREFNPMNVYRKDFKPLISFLYKPDNFDYMLKIAEALSADFPHVRVDLYNIDGQVFFGEMTFYNASGYTVFDPDSFDFELGSRFNLKSFP
jgi:hypothetical protein